MAPWGTFRVPSFISSSVNRDRVGFGFPLLHGDTHPLPRDILITNVDAATTFEELCEEVREMCSLHQGQPLTLKWVDSEGSPGPVSSVEVPKSLCLPLGSTPSLGRCSPWD